MYDQYGSIVPSVRVDRPTRGQRPMYNGHKRKHALKYQAVVTPDGMFASLWGLLNGCQHDKRMLELSGLMSFVECRVYDADGSPYCLYGDPAYGQSEHLCTPFAPEVGAGELSEEMKAFKKSMSRCRVTVEWCFKEATNKCAFIDRTRQRKSLLIPVGTHYRVCVCVMLSNLHSCLNGGNEISQFFGVSPPALDEYLHGVVSRS
ncbi:unnamed protein product [Sphacelaria rigidula]